MRSFGGSFFIGLAGGSTAVLGGGSWGTTRSLGDSFFFGFGAGGSTAVSRFGFSTAASGFTGSGGTGRLCLVSGLDCGASDEGAFFSAASEGGIGGLSFGLGLSCFSGVGRLGATLGAALSVTPVDGGTDALGATLSRCLFLSLSRAGAGVVAGGS